MFILVHKGDHWRMVAMYMKPKFDEDQCRFRMIPLLQQNTYGLIHHPTPPFQQQLSATETAVGYIIESKAQQAKPVAALELSNKQ